MSTFFRSGATALISGGASGVGFAMAQLCRKHGMHVALVDYNIANLDDAKKSLSRDSADLKTETYELDVGDLSAWKSILPAFKQTFPSLDLLMLNAGTSVKPSTKQPYEDVEYFTKTLGTNMYGVVNGLATFLPLLQEGARGSSKDKFGVIVTGSKQGITNPPGQYNPAYNMSKSAIKTLAEHLAHDLRQESNPTYAPNISVHLLIPGWTYTGLSGNSGPSPSEETLKKKNDGAWLPSQVADYAEKKIGEGKFYIVCPDGDVDEALDKARMEWAIGDVVEGRSALSRWDTEYEKTAAEGIKKRAEQLRG